jgi:hypothetical protein
MPDFQRYTTMDSPNDATTGYDQIKTESDPRPEVDIIAVCGLMPPTKVMCFFCDTTFEERQTCEEKRPVAFAGPNLRRHAVPRALQTSHRCNPEAKFDSTSGISQWDTGPTTRWPPRGENLRFLHTARDLYKKHWLCRMMRPGRSVRSLCELCLPLGQVICMIPMNTFKPTNTLRNLSSTTIRMGSGAVSKIREAALKHLKSTLLSANSVVASLGFNTWLVSLISRSTLTPEMLTYTKKQETGYEIELPLFLTEPGPVVFVYATMMYSIFAMAYYTLHHHHRYQHAFIGLGITAGIIFSFWFQPQYGAIDAITTIMPIFLSFALGFSNALHSLVGFKSYTEEEEISHALDLWASEIVNVNADEKCSLEKDLLSPSVSV